MSDNAEEGIARTQAAAAKASGTQDSGLQEHRKRGIASLDERIFVFILAFGLIVLAIVWAVANSPWVLYGSFGGVVFLIVIWGAMRIKRIERTRQERDREADKWRTKDSK